VEHPAFTKILALCLLALSGRTLALRQVSLLVRVTRQFAGARPYHQGKASGEFCLHRPAGAAALQQNASRFLTG